MHAGQTAQPLAQLQAGLALLAPQPEQPRVITFALMPGHTNTWSPVDYESSTGIKMWNEATEPLKFTFSANASKVNALSKKLLERAMKLGWEMQDVNILHIPDAAGVDHNFSREYGKLTEVDIRAHCATYIDQNTRMAHNKVQIYHYILNSLTKAGQLKILAESHKYHIVESPCGPLLFKLLMQKINY